MNPGDGTPAEQGHGRVTVVVRPGRRTAPVLGWLRQLLPAAVLLVAATGLTTEVSGSDSIVVEADDIDSPMSLAAALTRGQPGAVHE